MFGFGCKSKRDGTLSKKQQSIVERDHELILLAKSIVQEDGFSGLTMDKLTAASAYSKGTIYNHFSSKEDVVVALCVHSLKSEIALFSRAFKFEGSARDRMTALNAGYRLYARLEPVLSTCALMAKSPAIIEKASETRVKQLQDFEEKIIVEADKLVEQAIEAGDLKLPLGMSTDTIVFAAWASAFGANALSGNHIKQGMCAQRLQDPYTVLHTINMLLDGVQWFPLSSEKDYKKVWNRAEQELYGEELQYLESIGR